MSTPSPAPNADLLDAALRYAERGCRVVPLHTLHDGDCTCSKGRDCDKSPGKHPRTKNGLQDASGDPAQIRRWWAEWPAANVGILTGAASGIVVLDVDGEAGERSMVKLAERFGAPPETLTARTGGGGRHLIFVHPGEGRKIGNRQGLGWKDSKLDVRGDGGYIVAPPSFHASGRCYEWLVDVPPAAADWFLQVYDTLDAEQKAQRSAQRNQPAPPATVLPFRRPPASRERVLERARGYLEKMEPAVSGQAGHTTAMKAAAAMVRGFNLTIDEAFDLLQGSFNQRCQPPWDAADLRRKCEEAAEKSDLPWGYLLEAGAPPPTQRTRQTLSALLPAAAARSAGAASEDPGLEGPTAAEPPAAAGEHVAVPSIVTNGRQLFDVIEEAWAVALAVNEPPQLFRRGGAVVRLRQETETPAIAATKVEELFGVLLRVAEWVAVKEGKDGEVKEVPSRPDKDLVKDMLAIPKAELPPLDGVVTAPVFVGEGELVTQPGYSPAARLWYHQRPGFALPAAVPSRPTVEDVAAARELIEDLLFDFPFDGEADRANAVALLLLPFVRRMIDGVTPLHLISAPSPGSGKGLLADVASIIALGQTANAMSLPGDEESARKALFAELMGGPPLILLDNANERSMINSPSLASILTNREPKDRVLGLSQMVTVRNDAVWIMTGNNPQLSLELTRRCVRIKIDPKRDMPWMRTGFRHEDLPGWAHAQRGDLVRACLVLVRHWLVEGRPLRTKVALGTFQAWADTLGGLLDCAGFQGFLANSTKLYEEADEEGRMWREFVAAWAAEFGDTWRTAKELVGLASDKAAIGSVLGDKGEKSQQIRLGKALARLNGRVFGEHTIRCGIDQHSKAARYRAAGAQGELEQLRGAPAPGPEAAEGMKPAERSGDRWPAAGGAADPWRHPGAF